MTRSPGTLLHLSLASMAAAVLVAIVGLVKVTPITSMVLFVLGVPLFLAGFGGYLVVVYLDLKRHGVLGSPAKEE